MPIPTTERLRQMRLAATELKSLTQWKDPIIDEWLNMLDSIDTIATLLDNQRNFISPTTQTVTLGTLAAGTVSDVQTWGDGNEVHITETTGIDGLDVEYTFGNVYDFAEILVSFYYTGSLADDCLVQIYDATNTTWKTLFSQIGTETNYSIRCSPFPDISNTDNYINVSNELKIRFYFPITGTSKYDLYINYISIIGTVI